MRWKGKFTGLACVGMLGLVAMTGIGHPQNPAVAPDPAKVERGRYVVLITGCNDCHTAGYAESGGKVAPSRWLLGDRVGFRGPWGTTYPTNLRLSLSQMSEQQWIAYAKALQVRPPMPWFNLHAMTDADLGAMYHFIRSLQPLGERAPEALPPGEEAPQPVVQFPMPPK